MLPKACQGFFLGYGLLGNAQYGLNRCLTNLIWPSCLRALKNFSLAYILKKAFNDFLKTIERPFKGFSRVFTKPSKGPYNL